MLTVSYLFSCKGLHRVKPKTPYISQTLANIYQKLYLISVKVTTKKSTIFVKYKYSQQKQKTWLKH